MKKIYICLFLGLGLILHSTAATFTVNVSNNVFAPDNFTAVTGDTITWVWINGNHTSTSTNIPLGALPWNAMINQNNTSYSYVVSVTGIYDYQCNFHYTMGMVGHFTVVGSSGIEENASGIKLNIYANPVTRELQVDLNSSKSGMMNITLSDITGREVKVLASSQQSAGEHHMQYSIADFSSGMYLLKVDLDDSKVVRRVIIQ